MPFAFTFSCLQVFSVIKYQFTLTHINNYLEFTTSVIAIFLELRYTDRALHLVWSLLPFDLNPMRAKTSLHLNYPTIDGALLPSLRNISVKGTLGPLVSICCVDNDGDPDCFVSSKISSKADAHHFIDDTSLAALGILSSIVQFASCHNIYYWRSSTWWRPSQYYSDYTQIQPLV